MKYQEKAKELVEKFEPLVFNYNEATEESIDRAKQCALICVQNLIIEMEMYSAASVKYWQGVKSEIEKI